MLWRPTIQTRTSWHVAGVASVVLAAAIVFLLNWRPTVEVPLNIPRFVHDVGFAYWGPAPTFMRGIYGFKGDDNDNREQSTLVIHENGQALGPAHTIHDAVRQTGNGAFSHYGDYIEFSASDNTDPLANGRRYTATGTATLAPSWRTTATAALLAIVLANLFFFSGLARPAAENRIENRRSALDYRADIDGLRAVAVMLVVLFHLGLSRLPGGYVGVDVFFVISGYLITGIISSQIDQGTFSFAGFYQRRVKRIFPALFVVVAATLAAGFFLLLPGDYATTAKSAAYTVSATSNFYFLFHTGYFDAAAEMMPLLHTWSLGVEEQFYLAWPALLAGVAFMFRRDARAVTIALLLIAFLSYFLGTLLVVSDPKAAFYLPFTRAWEFVAGAILSQAIIGRLQIPSVLVRISGTVGLALIVGSALVITKDTPFPNWLTMLPVAGAALIVAPFAANCPARRFLSSWPVVFTGRISYSLYLWHWPIITLYRHYNLGRPLNATEMVCLTVLMFVVSILSWRFVEQPFRRAQWPAMTSIGMGVATAAALAGLAMVISSSAGFPQRIPPSARLYESLDVMWQWQCPQERDVPQFGERHEVCVLGANWDTAKKHGILIGDSHAEHMGPLLDVAARAAGVALLEPNFECMPLIGTTSLKRFFPEMPTYNQICTDEYAPIMTYIHDHGDIQIVVMAAAWSAYTYELYRRDDDTKSRDIGVNLMREGIKEITDKLQNGSSRKFLVISDVPRRQAFDVGCLARSAILLRPPCPATMFMTPADYVEGRDQEATNAMMRALPGEIPNLSVVVPHDSLCGPEGCTTVVNNEFLYRDAAHLRRNLTADTKSKLVGLLRLKESLSEIVAGLQQARPGNGL